MAETIGISRSSLYYQANPRASRADRSQDEAIIVPAEAKTARSGQWVSGSCADFFRTVQRELGNLPFIAEDLGLITPDVYALRDEFQIPGTRVFQFAFDGHADNPYLPSNYVPNTVVYTGTSRQPYHS